MLGEKVFNFYQLKNALPSARVGSRLSTRCCKVLTAALMSPAKYLALASKNRASLNPENC